MIAIEVRSGGRGGEGRVSLHKACYMEGGGPPRVLHEEAARTIDVGNARRN